MTAVDGVSFNVDRGEVVGIVGESGSGKTMTALSILRLVPEPGQITNGRILYGERDVVHRSSECATTRTSSREACDSGR